MKKIILFNIIILLFSSCDTPTTYYCSNGQTMDDCGNCRACESEECDWNDALDQCDVCNGDGASISCWNEELVCNISECDDYNSETWFIDLNFFTEDYYCISNNPIYNNQCSQYNNENSCNLFSEDYECSWIGSFEIYTNLPIYWENTSDQDITIYTQNTQSDYCDITIESGVEADCDQYDNQIACENSLCEWILSPTYNPSWDIYSITVPEGTIGISQFYFTQCELNNCGAFSTETEEIFCTEINNEEKCGIIKVIN